MQVYKILFFLFLFSFSAYGQTYKNDRLLTVRSKDSINDKPRMKGALGVNMKLNGYFNIYGGLQDNDTFNVGQIPVFGTDNTSNFKMDLYQTRISILGDYVLKNGETIKMVIEFDFWGGNGHMRLRKAYVQSNHWQIGQTINNFGDEVLWPNIMEWEGPPSGVWGRSPHVKYFNTFKNKKWIYELSLEAPIVDYITVHEIKPLVEKANQVTPDLTFALKNKQDWGHLRFSSILRNVKYKLNNKTGDFIGYGFTLSGLYHNKRGNNTQFQIVAGKGINAYIASIKGLGYDGYPNTNNRLEATPSYGGWISYEYFFTSKLHANIVYGFTHYSFENLERFIISDGITDVPENDGTLLLNGDFFSTNTYGIINLMYNPFKRMTLGIELDYGIKFIDFNGLANDTYVDNSKDRNAMRVSFGFMFYL